MITGPELSLLGVMVPVTTIALIVALALFLTKPVRQPALEEGETARDARLSLLGVIVLAASAIPMLLALVFTLVVDISMSVTNLFIGASLAYLMSALGLAAWHRLRDAREPDPGNRDTVVLVCPFSSGEAADHPIATTSTREAGQTALGPEQQNPAPPAPPVSPKPAPARQDPAPSAPRPLEARTAVRVYTPSDEVVVEKDQTISVQVITPQDLKPLAG